MRDRLHELGTDTEVVLLTFTNPDGLAAYRTTNLLPFPILVDHDRSAYRSFGLGRGSVARVYGWKVARRYWHIFRSEGLWAPLRRLRRPTEDTLQLGGDFIVDADGLLVYGFWGDGPDDRPSVDDLIRALPTGQL